MLLTLGGVVPKCAPISRKEGATPHLNDRHTVFGHVVSGQDVVHAIATAPTTRDRPNTDIVLEKVEIFRQ